MAERPPGFDPLQETVDDFDIDKTAPPQKSPLAAILPFSQRRTGQGMVGEETAPPQKSPLAAALPFRHGLPTPEDLQRLAPAGQPAAGAQDASKNTPSDASAAKHFGLSLDQYAALCAEVAVLPQTADATFARYGLATPEDRRKADAGWQERLRADDALMQRWQGLYLHYHEHYSRTGQK